MNTVDVISGGVAGHFTGHYGRPPAGVWAAPGRLNLIGEHTDYNDGFVLPFALGLRTLVAAAPAGDSAWRVASTAQDEPVTFGENELVPGAVAGWAGYVAGVVWALRERGYRVPPVDLFVDSEVPVGSGLSSSAALECAVLFALADLGGLDLPLAERPAVARRAENDYVGMPCGIMDQSASVFGRTGHALFLDCRSLSTEHIPFDPAAAGLAILVIDTRAPHRHTQNEYAARRATCLSAARTLGVPALRDVTDLSTALATLPDGTDRRRVRHVVTEDQRVLDTVALLRAGRVAEIGPLLTASHSSMRDDYEITVPEVDTAVEAALAAGAYGARMTGGGFGGCVLALVDAPAMSEVSAAVAKAYEARGFTAPRCFPAVPAAGATRLR